MSQVIIVANRLPMSVKKELGHLVFYSSIGGVVTGLISTIVDKQTVWIGWPGIESEELTAADRTVVDAEMSKHNYIAVYLSRRQIDDFYNGYSNSVLWPVFHNMPYEQLTVCESWWPAYRSVNRLFAEAVLGVSHGDSKVWIHDFQLLLVPQILRVAQGNVTLGFFLHIPFPTVKTFAQIDEGGQLLQGVLGADVIGFHTSSYVSNFMETCVSTGLAGASGDNQLIVDDRVIRVGDFPMGIDYNKYACSNKLELVRAAIRKYRRRYRGYKVIVAVDRLDPIKGLVERVDAYGRFLEEHPDQSGKVVFSLVAAPSRTNVPAYRKLANSLGKAVEAVNRTYATTKWQPIDYIHVSIPFEDVTALFQIADVAFIVPLRDGMNLAAKEFVASTHKHGVLILSETAGAAEQLRDAIIVDPRKPESLVAALEQALTMNRMELRSRLRRMQRQLATNTVQDWARDFISALQIPPSGPQHVTLHLRENLRFTLLTEYRLSKKHLLLLDYDGTLVPFVKNYRDAIPPESLLTLLKALGDNPSNHIVIVSGRSAEDLGAWFGQLPICLVAEHGATLKKANSEHWQTIEKIDTTWKKSLLPILENYVGQTPGARVEIKSNSLVWHYREAELYLAQKSVVAIKKNLEPYLKKYGLEIMKGNKVIEVKNPQISKGQAVQRWLKHGYDFVIAFGDDVTDEDLFARLPSTAHCVKVGHGNTIARYRVTSHLDVLKLLKAFTKPVKK